MLRRSMTVLWGVEEFNLHKGWLSTGPFTIQDRCGSKWTCRTIARTPCRGPIERGSLLGVPNTLGTLMIATQGLMPAPSSATPRRHSLRPFESFVRLNLLEAGMANL